MPDERKEVWGVVEEIVIRTNAIRLEIKPDEERFVERDVREMEVIGDPVLRRFDASRGGFRQPPALFIEFRYRLRDEILERLGANGLSQIEDLTGQRVKVVTGDEWDKFAGPREFWVGVERVF